MTDLAEHWTTTVIRDVADVFLGKTPARNDYTSNSNSKYKVVKFRDLKDGSVDFENAKQGFVRADASLLRTLKELRCGDVLITSAAHSGENIGKKCAYVSEIPSKFERVYFTGELLNVRCKDQTIGKWVYFFFRSRDGFEEIQEAVTGVHLTGGRAQHMSLPIAPRAEQRRIVAKLEKLLRRVDACQQRLAKIPVALKRFRQSVLAAACSGRLTADWRNSDEGQDELPRSWSLIEFGRLIADGPHNGLYKPQSCYGSGTLIVRIDAFYDGKITDWGELKRLVISGKEREQFALADGDILINRVNSPKFLGKAALVQAMPEESVYESNMMRLRLDRSRTRPDYAILYLRSAQGLEELRKNAKHAVNQSSINQEDVKGALFALPPLPEQQEIVRRVEALFALADQIEARYAKAAAYVEKLTQSILAKAFRGELVPQDPNDEAASILLERIRSAVTTPKAHSARPARYKL